MDAFRYMAESVGIVEPTTSETAEHAENKDQIQSTSEVEKAELEELKEQRRIILGLLEQQQKIDEVPQLTEPNLVTRELLFEEPRNNVDEEFAARLAEIEAVQEANQVHQWHQEQQIKLDKITEEPDNMEPESLFKVDKYSAYLPKSELYPETITPLLTPRSLEDSQSKLAETPILSPRLNEIPLTPRKKSSIFRRGETATLLADHEKQLFLDKKDRPTLLDPDLLAAVEKVASYGGLTKLN
mmetsp:Transcript_150601/g.288603  ORF Transcript_150601/g.288603 Transcript_150601/m.288603 type:complete len:242 (-) Transcript_150601:171-896(-)